MENLEAAMKQIHKLRQYCKTECTTVFVLSCSLHHSFYHSSRCLLALLISSLSTPMDIYSSFPSGLVLSWYMFIGLYFIFVISYSHACRFEEIKKAHTTQNIWLSLVWSGRVKSDVSPDQEIILSGSSTNKSSMDNTL